MKPSVYLMFGVIFLSGCVYLERGIDSFSSVRGSWGYKNPAYGSSVLTFNKDMTYELDIEGDGVANITGTYHIFENQIKLTDVSGEFDREKCSQPGVYLYDLDGKEVHYQLYADQCSYRAQALSVAWKRVKPIKK